MRQLFPDDISNTTKSGALDRVGAYAERHTAKFALQTHRNFGSLASWKNC
jgi:hypothetical protein